MVKNPLAKSVCFAAIAFAGSTATPAYAADTMSQNASCQVNYVQYAGDMLTVRCVNTGAYYGVFGPSNTGCAYRQSADSLKIMASIAQGAFLSGNSVIINYYASGLGGCNGNSAILFALQK